MGLTLGSVKTDVKVTPFKGISANKARETAAATTRGKGNRFTAAESNTAAAKARQKNLYGNMRENIIDNGNRRRQKT